MRLSRRSIAATLLLGFAAAALFWGLGRDCLWDDEAETALLAQRVLSHGLPYAALPGELTISQLLQQELGFDGLWTWTPWAQIYAAAISLKVFGHSAGGARALFALIGLACLALFYRFASEFFDDEDAGFWALGLLAGNVSLLLHFRQCRWFSLGVLEIVLLLWGYERLLRRRRFGGLLFFLGLAGLFHTQQLAFLSAFSALAAAHLLFFRSSSALFVRPLIASAFACAPWLLLQNRFGMPRSFPVSFWGKSIYYWAEINAHHMPLLLLLGWLLWLALVRGRASARRPQIGFLLVFIGIYLLMIAQGPFLPFYRYLVPLFPLLALLQAAFWMDLSAALPSRPLRATLFVLLAGTNAASFLFSWRSADAPAGHRRPRFLWAEYAGELIRPHTGPIGAVVKLLQERARPGDVVWATYGDLPLRFHTGLRVYGGLGVGGIPRLPRPDWVLVRAWITPDSRAGDRRLYEHIRRTLRQEDYKRWILDVPDTPWENRPELDEHHFRIPEGYPPITIHQRI